MKYLLIDSNQRTSDSVSPTDFSIQLYTPIYIRSFIRLLFCSIPNTNYTISSLNDTFNILFSDNTNLNIVLKNGIYDVLTLENEIKQKSIIQDLMSSLIISNTNSHYLQHRILRSILIQISYCRIFYDLNKHQI